MIHRRTMEKIIAGVIITAAIYFGLWAVYRAFVWLMTLP
jgi:hypothetical protein